LAATLASADSTLALTTLTTLASANAALALSATLAAGTARSTRPAELRPVLLHDLAHLLDLIIAQT
jgi:hypothetical protein